LRVPNQAAAADDPRCPCAIFTDKITGQALLLAVGLLDCTIKIFYDDSLKFFLPAMGTSFPSCLDISSDRHRW
jgi:U3 small nucleolar RNA-associated protein 12